MCVYSKHDVVSPQQQCNETTDSGFGTARNESCVGGGDRERECVCVFIKSIMCVLSRMID